MGYTTTYGSFKRWTPVVSVKMMVKILTYEYTVEVNEIPSEISNEMICSLIQQKLWNAQSFKHNKYIRKTYSFSLSQTLFTENEGFGRSRSSRNYVRYFNFNHKRVFIYFIHTISTPLQYSSVTVMLLTSWCWWHRDVGDIVMLVTSWCW